MSFNPHARGKDRLVAYYFAFEPTGMEAVDNILAAVASAGKSYHFTADWNEPTYGDRDEEAESPREAIQRMANEAAAAIRAPDGSLLDIALGLHAYHTGASDCYASWCLGPEQEARDIQTLKDRLAGWRPSDRPFDDAVRQVLVEALRERGEWL